MELWIVGKVPQRTQNTQWEHVGVFSTELKALAACTSEFHFIGPVKLDEAAPTERTQWPGAYFPKARLPMVEAKCNTDQS